ncbi:phage antirepressor KilAC domain-containing protein [Streptobacillus moniliformis]|uniref:phage antirepressor KilAC domain-containing protein n=1 Tax=Streptobacillus moniliformis TaxID=34105 RepID=UPI000A9262A4|nr:phage antirepressor KilAC domain-containing protein [Streptobacillus moniliformis]
MEIITIKNVNGYIKDNIAYLKLEDVARGLGFTQQKNNVEYIRWETIIKYCNEFSQLVGKDDFIPENIFYKLCMKANNDVARKFQDLVCDEILPSIRKNGMYAVDELLDNPDLAIKTFMKLKEEREKNKLLQEKIEQDKSKVIFAEALETSKKSELIGELAKTLKNNGIETGQNRLFEWLRKNGYLCSRKGEQYNMPTQKSMELKLFEVKRKERTNPNGSITIDKTTVVTPKGQQYFINKFLKNKEVI